MTTTANELLNGIAASEFLGVKVSTLYAYVSRGLIDSIGNERGRERSYRLDDLIKLRNSLRGFKRATQSAPAEWPGPLIKSSITLIRDDGHFYRGKRVTELALTDIPFEEIAELLWSDDRQKEVNEAQASHSQHQAKNSKHQLPKGWQRSFIKGYPLAINPTIPNEVSVLKTLKIVVANTEMLLPETADLTSPNILQQARQLIMTMASAVGLPNKLIHSSKDRKYPIAEILASTLSGKPSKEQIFGINRALVLCADHELNASTLAARVAASCDASLHSCILSALGTFSGALHGGSSLMLEQLVLSTLNANNLSLQLRSYLEHNKTIPGFGSVIYPKLDPRAEVLIHTATEISNSKELKRLIEIISFIRDKRGTEPNLDAGLLALSFALSLPQGTGTGIFAIGRTAGWIAHALEQRLYGGTIRPRARYIGKSPSD
jgi:citrate synthase